MNENETSPHTKVPCSADVTWCQVMIKKEAWHTLSISVFSNMTVQGMNIAKVDNLITIDTVTLSSESLVKQTPYCIWKTFIANPVEGNFKIASKQTHMLPVSCRKSPVQKIHVQNLKMMISKFQKPNIFQSSTNFCRSPSSRPKKIAWVEKLPRLPSNSNCRLTSTAFRNLVLQQASLHASERRRKF